jgi:MHS family alpha-ketoglutarate permease-like MFS transporter
MSDTSAITSEAPPREQRRLRSICGGAAGNVIEWYDFLAYSIFSIYFSPAFFPHQNPTVQLLNAAAIAAVGYVVRPLGSWLIGVLADRRGRRLALSVSVAMMCLGSLIIAVTPGYEAIGMAAPITLILARLLQGFSMGGEAGTAATYLSEMAPRRRRGFFVGFVQVTVVLGQLLALGVMLLLQLVLTGPQLEGWGWRIPFLIGGLLTVFAFYLRSGIEETESFTSASHDRPKRNLLRVLTEYPHEVLLAIGISVGGTVAFYTFTIYLQKYMINTAGLSKDLATLVTTSALLVYMVMQPLFGLLSDRVGRRPVLLLFGLGGTFLTVPIMTALGHVHSGGMAFLLNLAALMILAGFSSIHWLVKSELFPAQIRALGVGLPFAAVSSILGGTTEYVALRLKASDLEPYFFVYVSAWCAITMIAAFVMPETRDLSTIDREGVA